MHGLHECLTKLGKEEEARRVKQQLDVVARSADTAVVSSCYCRTVPAKL
jgi:hypothetical protein